MYLLVRNCCPIIVNLKDDYNNFHVFFLVLYSILTSISSYQFTYTGPHLKVIYRVDMQLLKWPLNVVFIYLFDLFN